MQIEYRVATSQSIKDILDIRVRLVEEDSGLFSPEEKQRFRMANEETLVHNFAIDSELAILAYHEQEPIGACCASLYLVLPGRKLPNGKNAYIQNVYIAPAYRRKGIGKQLLKMVLQELDARGYGRITLHATDMGKNLFVSCGFVEEDTSLSLLSHKKKSTVERRW